MKKQNNIEPVNSKLPKALTGSNTLSSKFGYNIDGKFYYLSVDDVKQFIKEIKDEFEFAQQDPYVGFDGQILELVFRVIDKKAGDLKE